MVKFISIIIARGGSKGIPNKNIMDLVVTNLVENFAKQNKDTINDELNEEIKKQSAQELDDETCSKYYLSKKYNSITDLEDDNNKLIFFDTIYDNTFYSLKNEFKNEESTMDNKAFFEFLL